MVLAVFVDGLGIGDPDSPHNPLAGRRWLALDDLFARAVPLDACLGVPGLPQSATGQVTLFTGLNAARHAGRHIPGLPGPTLRELLGQGTFYDQVLRRGGTATFLNGFSRRYLARMSHGLDRGQGGGHLPVSATTLAAVRAGLPLRDAGHARRGEAIYHDLTGEMQFRAGEDVPVLTPVEAARVAVKVARQHNLTLFEYFLTDRAGHSQDRTVAAAVPERLDAFLAELLPAFAEQGCLAVFSDHGNIEDLGVPTHTCNPVPLALWCAGDPAAAAEAARACTWLGDVAGLLVRLAMDDLTAPDRRPARPPRPEPGEAEGA